MNVTTLGAESTNLRCAKRSLPLSRTTENGRRTSVGRNWSLRQSCSLSLTDYPSVLVRVKLVLTRHHNDDGREPMNDFNRGTLGRQYVRKSPIDLRCLVEPTAAKDD